MHEGKTGQVKSLKTNIKTRTFVIGKYKHTGP